MNVRSLAPKPPGSVSLLAPPAGLTPVHLLVAGWFEAFRTLPEGFESVDWLKRPATSVSRAFDSSALPTGSDRGDALTKANMDEIEVRMRPCTVLGQNAGV